MTRFRSTAAAAALLVSFASLASAQGKSPVAHSRAAIPRAAQAPAPARPRAVPVVFRDADRDMFRDYFRTRGIGVQRLPPGIAKNVARGKPLPAGIAKRAFPPDLVVMIPRGRDASLYIVGDRVVAVRKGVVADVMTQVFP